MLAASRIQCRAGKSIIACMSPTIERQVPYPDFGREPRRTEAATHLRGLTGGPGCAYNDHMAAPTASTIVGARELKTRLGTWLRRVQRGAVLTVTERDRPVAEIRAIPETGDGIEDRLNQMARLGLITRGTGRPLRRFKPVRIKGVPLSRTVLEDRADRL